MNKVAFIFILTLGLSMVEYAYGQAVVEIEWHAPQEYTDVKPSQTKRSRFMQSTFTSIDAYILKLAQSFPAGYRLKLKVTDLDLAGQVWPASFAGLGNSASDVRVIKRLDIPRMNFSYELTNAEGDIVKQANVNLKDMSFQIGHSKHFASDSLTYEKNMLKKWFLKEFKTAFIH
ncbi:DUF3016 domain-containing protein [Paraglaciecola sp.]|uniref:DUF3016 domain-containing protein n=1 Tax=Paraglaciecola sp. TaxID=1920173 RepID=UPI003EF1AA94